jgi:FAD/FMN-containing dehydrogenase
MRPRGNLASERGWLRSESDPLAAPGEAPPARRSASDEYAERKARLQTGLRENPETRLGLGKDTSNLFRQRAPSSKRLLDVRDFKHVLQIDPESGWVDVEGMTTYEDLVAETLKHGVMPAVVPQLKTITIGGAVAGVGIEASSFKYGLVHETVLELEVLTGNGEVVLCTPHNEHADLFYGFPNSYGSLGYALRVRVRTVPVKPYVRLEHLHIGDAQTFWETLTDLCTEREADFIDGVVFGPSDMTITVGRFVESAPYVSDYHFEHIYYRSIRRRNKDFLSVADFLWRWDTDWFWCSKNLGMQNPLIRRLVGRKRLNSRTYTRLMRWNTRVGFTKTIDRLLGWNREHVIQDIDIPLQNAPGFLHFYLQEIQVLPMWICPIGAYDTGAQFPLYPRRPARLYINFGFWDIKRTREAYPPGHFNRLIEHKTMELGGIKSLYSDSYFSEAEFWGIYGKSAYDALKKRYDPQARFADLYQKCVQRA